MFRKSNVNRKLLQLTSSIKFSESPKLQDIKKEKYYTSETDIMKYHRHVIYVLDEDIKRNSIRKNKIRDLLVDMEKSDMTVFKQKICGKKIEEQKREIEKSKLSKQSYIRRVTPVLIEYKTARKNMKIELGKIVNDYNMRMLIHSFINIANSFCTINLLPEPIDRNTCPYCLTPINNSEDTVECTTCANMIHRIPDDIDYDDFFHGITNNSYKSELNYASALTAYEGLHRETLPVSLFEDVAKYCDEKNINKYTLQPIDAREIFKVTDNSEYFDDVHLFLYLYINRKLPDISDIREDVLKDYKIFNNVFCKLKGNDRHSSLNSQLTLYIFLHRRGHKCSPNDFKIPGTEGIATQCKTYIVKAFTILGWDYSDYV